MKRGKMGINRRRMVDITYALQLQYQKFMSIGDLIKELLEALKKQINWSLTFFIYGFQVEIGDFKFSFVL